MKRLGAAMFMFVSALMVALPAAAQENDYPMPPEGAPRVVQPGAPGVGDGDALAVTGADLAVWIGIGVALVALGIVLLRLGRRASQT